jgi:nitroreductase
MVDKQYILKIIQQRQSTKAPFDPRRKVKRKEVLELIEGARWAPTAHNMQNFEIIVVDDPAVLKRIGNIKSRISEDFLRENYEQLSFSKKELLKKRVGILGENFPASWKDPQMLHDVAENSPPGLINWIDYY